ncbi:MAG: hypothetical protein IKT52_01285 [Oscillospiraceae bacterium]|nr:hypothetical protein [Oscillospiraceae bacterium]
MYAKKKNVSMKVVVLLLAVVLLIGCVAGGTLAYLMAKSSTVTNTFVAGEIGTLSLAETTGDSYIVTPGVDITKDPVVTFSGNNVAAYIFVKVEARGWTESKGTFSIGDNQEMKWTVADSWTKLENVPGVYYREVVVDTDTANTAETEKYGIINGNTITVSSQITKDNISNYTMGLTFTAYAIQKDGFNSAADAWDQAKNATN